MSNTHFFPVHRHAILSRAELLEDKLHPRPALVTITGSAGTGKSVMASQVASALSSPERPAVWVDCSGLIADVEALWQHMIATVAEAGLAPEPTTSRSTGRDVTTGLCLRDHLPNDLLIVLDDFHHVSDASVEESVVETLEQHAGLIIVATSRAQTPLLHSPDARLRIPIIAFSSDDLQFTDAQINELLGLRVPQLDSSARSSLTQYISSQSHGWPLAVHALIVEHHFGHTTDQVPRDGAFITAFVQRTLDEFVPDDQRILLATSLCTAVTENVVSQMLDAPVERVKHVLNDPNGLGFRHWQDERGVQWYQLHDLIRAELATYAPTVLSVSEIRQVHYRAAIALRDKQPNLAVSSAIKAEAWDFLADLVMTRPIDSIKRVRPDVYFSDVPKAVQQKHPFLALLAAIDEVAFPSGKIGQLLTAFRTLSGRPYQQTSQEAGSRGLTAALFRMGTSRYVGLESTALSMARRVRQIIEHEPHDLDRYPYLIEFASLQSALTFFYLGKPDEAKTELERIFGLTSTMAPESLTHATAIYAWMQAWRGDMPAARIAIRRCEELRHPPGWQSAYVGAGYRIAAAIDELHRGNHTRAEEHINELSEHEATIEQWQYIALVKTLIVETQSGPGAASQFLETYLRGRSRHERSLRWGRQVLQPIRARLAWQSGRIVSSESKLLKADTSAVYQALSQASPSRARAIAGALLNELATARNPQLQAELHLLHAEAARLDGDTNSARSSARTAIVILNSYDLTLPMRALSRRSAVKLAALVPELPVEFSLEGTTRSITPLTDAELRAISAVATHASLRAAAASLYLTPETVRGYMKQVYRKLGVSSRDEAIRVAGEAGLLSNLPSSASGQRAG